MPIGGLEDMFIDDRGTGPAVLLLHGIPSPASDFGALVERLTPRFRVLVPEFPGAGRSAALASERIEDVDQALVDALAARGVEQVRAIVGFSSGAYRAFEMVLRGRVAPDLVVALGAFATFDEPARQLRRDVARTLDADPAYLYSAEIRSILRDLMLSPRWREEHPDDVVRVEHWVDTVDPAGFAAEMRALAECDDLRPELPRLATPLVLRVGELDAACPAALSREIADLAPQARLDVVPGCGHTLLIEDRPATVEAIATAIER